jgi:hypothetical protein
VITPKVAEIQMGKNTRSPTRVGSVLPNSLLQNESSEFDQPPASLSVLAREPESDMNPSFTTEKPFCCIDYLGDFGELWRQDRWLAARFPERDPQMTASL